ncbi:MAG: hypothetical protein AABX08_01515 [Nanoarchaeota archaeon]
MKNKVMVFSVLALLIALPLSLAQAITAQPSNAIEAKPADITAAPVGADTMLAKADTQPTPLLKKTLKTLKKSNRDNRNNQATARNNQVDARNQLCKGDYDRLGNGKLGNGVVNAHDIDGFIKAYSRFEGKTGRISDRASIVGTYKDMLFWITDIDNNNVVNKEDMKGFIKLLFNEEKPLCKEY